MEAVRESKKREGEVRTESMIYNQAEVRKRKHIVTWKKQVEDGLS